MKKLLDMKAKLWVVGAGIIGYVTVASIYLFVTLFPVQAQSVTGHPDTTQHKQTIPDLWLLTDSLRLIVKQSNNPVESIEAIYCAKWIEYRIVVYSEEPRGDVWDYNEWRVRYLIDNSEVFKK